MVVVNAAVGDLAVIHRLTNLNDINRLLHETVAKERSIDDDLDKLLSKRADLERTLLKLNAPTAETLELVHADCEQLLGSAQSTAELANHISSKVRRLDTVQTNVAAVLKKVGLILDRTACIDGVQAAMEAEDYEAAAQHIASFTKLESELSSSAAASLAVGAEARAEAGQLASQRQVLVEAAAQLRQVVERRFEEAAARRDTPTVVRYTKLYKPLGQQEEGLRRFCDYIRQMVSSQARSHLSRVQEEADSGKKVDWAAALTLIFKEVGMALEEQAGTVQDTFGPGALLDLATALQTECDAVGSRLLGRFQEAKRIPQLVKEAGSKKGKDASGLDHRTVEGYISELLALCRLAEEYNQFMLGKMRAAAEGSLSSARETTFRSGGLNVCVRELLGHYMALEELYMNDTVAMAIRIDEVVPGSSTSSMVDDVFFILRKCGVRALASGNVQVISALLMELNNVLANHLQHALAARLALGPARLLASAPSGLEGSAALGPGLPGSASSAALAAAPQAAYEFAVGLNNSDVAADYVAKLKTELESYLGELFAGTSSGAGDRERVRTVLLELGRAAGELRQSHTKGLEALAEGLMPRLRTVLEEVAAVSYQLSEAEYAAAESGEGWVQRLLVGLELAVTWLQPLLTANNYEGMVHGVLDKVVARLEALLSRKAFSQLGGLQLDRDTRTLVSHLADLTHRTVRDKFARLNQMALVLGLESVDELVDYWGGDSALTWRLTAAEVRSTLSQRADFSPAAIAALQLP
ncbi:component of oligomeric golgi complex 4 [Haematococcus lacustris]